METRTHALLVALAFAAMAAGCGEVGAIIGTSTIDETPPRPVEQPADIEPLPPLADPVHAALCVDGSKSYDPSLWQQGLDALAREQLELVTLGSAGHRLWVRQMDGNAYDLDSNLVAGDVPAVRRPPVEPDLEDNPFGAADLRAAYLDQLQRVRDELAAARSRAEQVAAQLRDLQYPAADFTDVFGCIQAGSELLDDPFADRFLILASDLEHDTSATHADDLRLDGIHVRVFPWQCEAAAGCATRKADWTATFEEMGAASVRIAPPHSPIGLLRP